MSWTGRVWACPGIFGFSCEIGHSGSTYLSDNHQSYPFNAHMSTYYASSRTNNLQWIAFKDYLEHPVWRFCVKTLLPLLTVWQTPTSITLSPTSWSKLQRKILYIDWRRRNLRSKQTQQYHEVSLDELLGDPLRWWWCSSWLGCAALLLHGACIVTPNQLTCYFDCGTFIWNI